MALRASISVEVLQASVSSAKASASITYELAHATGIWTDPDSKNRVLRDEYALSDVRFNLVEKNVADNFSFSDVKSTSFVAGKTDSISFTESFLNVIHYNRHFTDAFTLDDLSQIDKDFYGNKGNIFAFTDVVGLTHSKKLTDTYTVGDVSTLLLSKVASDSFTFTDSSYATFNKIVSDAFVLDDAALIDKDYYGNKGNVVGLNEVFVRAVDYKRDLSGSTTINSEVLGSNSLGAQSTPETRVLVQDVSIVRTGKNVDDSVGFSDSNRFNIAKFISDAFALDDAAMINKDYSGSKGNVFSLSEVLASAVAKVLGDSFSFSDSEYRSFTKNYSNDSVTFTEIHNKNSSKGLSDSFAFSEVYGVQLTKNVVDAFALDDSALIDKDYFGNKGNIVGISDQVTVEYFYGGLIGQRPLNTMSLN